MSFNISTRLNNLSLQVQQLTASSVTNPLTSNLNCASYNIINCDNITAPSGTPMTLDAGNSQVNVNSTMQVNNPLNVVNASANNSLVVSDASGGDTSCFVVDASGNVGVKVNPANALTSDFTVAGNVSVSGDISCNNINASNVVNSITAGSGISSTGGATPTISNTGVLSVSGGSSGISITGTSQNPVVNNTGVLSVSGTGTGISVGGTAQNPVIANTGVTQIVAGSNITLSPPSGTGIVTITAPATGLAPITSYIFSDSISNISPIGGVYNSPTHFTAPTTGIYLIEYGVSLTTSPTGLAPFTQVSFNPVAREYINLYMSKVGGGGISDSGAYIPYITTLPNTGFYSQFMQYTSLVLLNQNDEIYLTSYVNNTGTCTWGQYNANVNIIKLC